VREIWGEIIDTGALAIDDNADGDRLYMPVLELAEQVEEGALAEDAAIDQARDLIDRQTLSAAESRMAAR